MWPGVAVSFADLRSAEGSGKARVATEAEEGYAGGAEMGSWSRPATGGALR